MKARSTSMSKFLASKSDKHLHTWGFKDSGFESIGDKVVKTTFTQNDRFYAQGFIDTDGNKKILIVCFAHRYSRDAPFGS